MMRRLVLAALLSVVCLAPAQAQNVTCPTRPPGDSSNACASTAFVQAAAGTPALTVGSTVINGGTNTRILFDNAGVLGEYSPSQVNTFTGALTGLTGDATASGPGSAALTLATVNANTGSFGSGTSIPNFTVNGKGLVTAAGATTLSVANANLAAMTQNAVKGAATSTAVADLSVPGCSTASSALIWTTNTGFGCNSSISGALVSVVTYSSTQTITILATKANLTMWGGTGGSGGSSNASASTGGTGGAGCLTKYLSGLTPGNTLAFTLGAAGTAGAATPTNGGNGSASTLASGTQTISTLTANGSNGSAGNSTASSGTAGTAGGTASGGDVNASGVPAAPPIAINTTSAYGGMSGCALNFGAYGVPNTGGPSAGNAGTAGGLVVQWYQ